jgi:glycosyltransferase involved in cell wall biosynthesis
MKANIYLEHRFKRTPDGQVWSPFFTYDMWTRYLRVFSEVAVCARVQDVASVGKDMALATGDGVSLIGLPYYQGPQQYLKKRRAVQAALASTIQPGCAYIGRVPGNVSGQAIAALRSAELPYAVEVVGDPWDTFSPGSSTHPLRWFFRRMFTRSMRRECANSAVSLYVTEHALQRRYKPREGSRTFHASNVFLPTPAPASPSTHAVSDVCLPNSAFVAAPRERESFAKQPVRFVCVGSFNLLYKAQDVLIKAFAKAVKRGLDGHLSFVGDGMYRPSIEALARQHPHLDGRVEFLGQLKGGASVRDVLNRSHIFVLPSRQEGLPRAALEAMALGLPCIGSNVGGFPEILEPDAIVRPGDVNDLAECLTRLAANPTRLAEMSAHNLRRAADFHAEKLAVRQTAFYAAVRDLFADFWANHPGALPSSSACEAGLRSQSKLAELANSSSQAA